MSEKRDAFVRLIGVGVLVSEACRRVGVHRRTGMRWRHGRTIITSSGEKRHYPSVIMPSGRQLSSRFLSEDERIHLADLRRRGFGVRMIATELGRSPSTVSRELRRNGDPCSVSASIGRSLRSVWRWTAVPGLVEASCSAIGYFGSSCRPGSASGGVLNRSGNRSRRMISAESLARTYTPQALSIAPRGPAHHRAATSKLGRHGCDLSLALGRPRFRSGCGHT